MSDVEEREQQRENKEAMLFKLRMDIAKRCAAEMSDNPALDAASIAERSFDIADAVIALSGILGEDVRKRLTPKAIRGGEVKSS